MYKIETERGDLFDVNKNIIGMVTVGDHLNTTYGRLSLLPST
ncbi:hypothetical protein [Ruminococcus flavefaciens]|nr:hypothetical protein [Ruminococcus flavefaciens]